MNTPILKQIAQRRCRCVRRIAQDWKLCDHVIEERDNDFLIRHGVVRMTGEERAQQNHRHRIIPIIGAVDIGHPDGISGKNELDALRTIALNHTVERHLSVPQRAVHEGPAGEHHALGIDADLMLLPLAEDRVVGLPVGSVPVRVFLADPIDHGRTVPLGFLHKAVDSRFRDGRMVEPVAVGMPDEEKLVGNDLREFAVTDCCHRRLCGPCHLNAEPPF